MGDQVTFVTDEYNASCMVRKLNNAYAEWRHEIRFEANKYEINFAAYK